ncbi:MAG: pilus assembly protein PilM [Elusimicrobiota bacterium]|nr:pilus assembly protein PilM [Elusimicrobiota bacterium]
MGKYDALIEQLAFGSDRPRLATCLGLYLSPETIYISETHKDKSGKIVVDHLVRIPVPSDGKAAGATATMNTDFLTDPKKVGDLIRQSMAQIRWNSKNVRVTLSHHLGLLRYFAMPAMERRFLRSAIPLEAKKYIPIAFDALANDWQSAPMPPDAAGRARTGVLIAVTQKKNLANITGLLDSLGLKLVGLEVAPCSVLRLWQGVNPPAGPDPYAQVHFDGGAVRVLISERGLPVFFREVFLGEEATLADLRKVDLAGCLSFVSKQLNLPRVGRVFVGGSNASLPQFIEAFSQESGAPAEPQDTAKALMIKGGDWGGFASIGASAKDLVESPVALDLAATDRVTEEERAVARDIFIAGAALAAFFALTGIYNNMTYGMRARELSNYQVDPDVKLALQGRAGPDIQQQLTDMQAQLDQLRTLTRADRPKLSAVLREIVSLMPQSVWLTGVTVANPLGTTPDKAGLEISLKARAQGQSSAEEQDMAFQFQETLRRSELLGKLFEVNMSLQAKVDQPGGGEGAPGMDPRALTQKIEERTGFTLVLKAKKT